MPWIYKAEALEASLDTKLKNIGFQEDGGFYLRVYDKNVFEKEIVELQVYIKYFDFYRATGKFYQYSFYTDETIDAAKSMAEEARNIIKLSKFQKLFEQFEEDLDKGDGLACFDYSESLALFLETKQYKFFRVNKDCCAVSKKEKYGTIKLKVPSWNIRFVRGKGGRNIKEMDKLFNAKYIKVVPEDWSD